MNLRAFVARALENCAFIAKEQNEPAHTARILGASDAAREELGTSAVAIHRMTTEYESALTWLHGQLNHTNFEDYRAEGQALSTDQAIAYALEE